VAIKRVAKERAFRAEDRMWRRVLGHGNVLPLLDTFLDAEGRACFVSPLCEGGELDVCADAARARRGAVVLGVLSALAHCHARSVAHMDVKPGNILVRGDGRVQLADFGCSQESTSPTGGLQLRLGTPCYVAPEIIASQSYGHNVDVWSLGVVAFQLWAGGAHPFYDFSGDLADARKLLLAMAHAPVAWERLEASGGLHPETASPGLRSALARCLERDKHARADAAEARALFMHVLEP
jgi:serine/threonine protein kinase